MRVANLVPDTQYAIQQSQQRLAGALQQLSTGLRVNQLSDDPAASANFVVSLAASANVDQYTKNVHTVSAQLQTADSALSSVVTSLNTAITLGTSAAGSIASSGNKQAIASQVQGILSSVVAQGNASYQGVFLFGGSSSSTAPIEAASTTYISNPPSVQPPLTATYPLTAGSVTTVSDASTGKTFAFTVSAGQTISNLSAAVAAAAAAGTLSPGTTAAVNANGNLVISSNSSANGLVVSSNDPVLGKFAASAGTEVTNAYAYVGDTAVNRVQVGDFVKVATNVPGNQLFTSGANAIGALNGLITALQSGSNDQIQAATNAVSTALNSVGQQRVPLGNTISQLNAQETDLRQDTLTLSTEQTSLVGISLAIAATNLAQADTGNSAVLAAAAKVLPQTLLNYLSHA